MKMTKHYRRLLFKKKEYIVDKKHNKKGYLIRNCDSNVAKMNVLEYMIYQLGSGTYYRALTSDMGEVLSDAWTGILSLFVLILGLVSYVFP